MLGCWPRRTPARSCAGSTSIWRTRRLKIDEVAQAITPKTRIVAVGYASNAVGTINPVKRVIDLAHAVGALVYVDAVQYAPHGLIDVRALDCDFLVLLGLQILLARTSACSTASTTCSIACRPTRSARPMTNACRIRDRMLNHEGIAGTLGAIRYFELAGDPARGYRPLAERRVRAIPKTRASGQGHA